MLLRFSDMHARIAIMQYAYRMPSQSSTDYKRFAKGNVSQNSSNHQRWSRGQKARGQGQGQGHKKNPRPRPRPRTAFPRTEPLKAKDRNARGQGQGPRTQAQVFSKKKGLQKFFSGDLHSLAYPEFLIGVSPALKV